MKMSEFFTFLGLLFIALKVSHVINWSWWLVLLPFAFFPIAFVVIILLFIVAAIFSALMDKFVE